ncbi:MAG: hypothetical protein QXY87_10785 [Saccharolobus sp.]|uniref:hypothetical protein n=1 Tax=Saccharolobus TaxID=2100760 RepID=UPI001F108997|nr:hypothetical protein [Saccharolobus shibatae]MCH4816301.1 hypothetical protein [Saccharolobus shibatae]
MVNLYDCALTIEELKMKGYLDISEFKEKNYKNVHKFIQFLTRNEIVKRTRNRLLLLGDFPKYFIYNISILTNINNDHKEAESEITINIIPTSKLYLVEVKEILGRVIGYEKIRIKESIISYSNYSKNFNLDYDLPSWNIISVKSKYFHLIESDNNWKFIKYNLFLNIFNFNLNVKFHFNPRDYGIFYSTNLEDMRIKCPFNSNNTVKLSLVFPFNTGHYSVRWK